MIGQSEIPDENSNDESNARVRKDWQNFKKIIFNRSYQIVFIAISVLVFDFVLLSSLSGSDPFKNKSLDNKNPVATSTNQEITSDNANDGDRNCNVAGINMHGDIVTYIAPENFSDTTGKQKSDEVSSENIYFAVKDAESRDNVKAIIVEIDSGGGLPVAAEEIEKVLNSSTKPVIAYIRSIGASAAYWSATGASRIFASPSSQVGSIAITASYLDKVKSNQQDGYNFNDLTTGKYKNAMNSNKTLTEEEKKLVLRDLQMTHNLFVNTVAKNRNMDVNKVKELANGWAYNGEEALKLGLVDELGGLDDVKNYLKTNILNGQEANVCW